MALKNLASWNNKGAAVLTGSACGSGDKVISAACGSGDKVIASACGSGDKALPSGCGSSCGSGDK